MKPKSKTIGILGGMGPYATASFYSTLLQLTPALKDWDHIHVVIDSNPHIPSRSRHHLYGESSPVAKMIESCRRLEAYPVDFIVIPCNSASYFLPDVQEAVGVPILNIMEITVDALASGFPHAKSVLVLGGIITYDSRTYEQFLNARGYSYIHHAAAFQRRVECLIERIKINDPHDEIIGNFRELIKDILQETPADIAILGCTEFGCLNNIECGLPLIDSSLELARRAVKEAIR